MGDPHRFNCTTFVECVTVYCEGKCDYMLKDPMQAGPKRGLWTFLKNTVCAIRNWKTYVGRDSPHLESLTRKTVDGKNGENYNHLETVLKLPKKMTVVCSYYNVARTPMKKGDHGGDYEKQDITKTFLKQYHFGKFGPPSIVYVKKLKSEKTRCVLGYFCVDEKRQWRVLKCIYARPKGWTNWFKKWIPDKISFSTQMINPTTNPVASGVPKNLTPDLLPPGWQTGVDKTGKRYYIDWNTAVTGEKTYENPAFILPEAIYTPHGTSDMNVVAVTPWPPSAAPGSARSVKRMFENLRQQLKPSAIKNPCVE